MSKKTDHLKIAPKPAHQEDSNNIIETSLDGGLAEFFAPYLQAHNNDPDLPISNPESSLNTDVLIANLKKLTNFHEFKEVIENTRDIETLREADQLMVAMREIVQRQIKIHLWGEDIPGTVHFNEIVKTINKKDGSISTYGYLKASTRNSTRMIKSLDSLKKVTPPQKITSLEARRSEKKSMSEQNLKARK